MIVILTVLNEVFFETCFSCLMNNEDKGLRKS